MLRPISPSSQPKRCAVVAAGLQTRSFDFDFAVAVVVAVAVAVVAAAI